MWQKVVKTQRDRWQRVQEDSRAANLRPALDCCKTLWRNLMFYLNIQQGFVNQKLFLYLISSNKIVT